ncbi:putative spermidine/putrescine transport system ATP-binding protein [Kaistia soli DSM 19436]|uniref:Putative spermidine/putrescine transport system ATP-binding protein n=1 Tax=Kaistia soli DSM 19436 TaxID=1122133 RepID=A0A1M5PFD9_9HYPH|nr:ABC transporter ATP-binding protein [Kaistia soli]SHH00524.1 putative spermidine/putrescine transport system ATP-binding protein [Kaistia soli DSM 19436]
MQTHSQALTVNGLSHTYAGQPAVEGVSFHVAAGEIAALLGPSGCGKSTVLRAIAGLLPAKPGVISLGGRDISPLPGRERGIGMVFQNYALFPHMTVAENIAYPLSFRGWDRKRRQARVEELLATVQLGGLERRLPRQLSGGQQQRVAVARALAVDPALLLLDEPFAALDRALRLDLQIELVRLQQTLGITTVIVTHDQEEAQALASQLVVMNRGHIEQTGTPAEIYDHPASLFVNSFVGYAGKIRAVVESASAAGSTLKVSTGETLRLPRELRFAPGSPVVLTVRPERLSIVDRPSDFTLAGRLLVSTPLGPDVIRSIALADGTEIKLTEPRDLRRSPLESSAPLFIALDVVNLHVFPAGEAL